MGLPQLTEEIFHPGPGIPGLIQALVEEGVIRIPSLTPNSALQKLPYPYDAAILKFQVSLGMEYLVLSIIKNSAEILHKISKFDQILRISKQHGKISLEVSILRRIFLKISDTMINRTKDKYVSNKK